MAEPNDELLYRYFDGELSAEERADFEARLAEDEGLRGALALLEQTREAVRRHSDEMVQAASFEGFSDAVLAKVADEPTPSPAAEPRAPVVEPAPGLGQRLAAWWRAHWTPVVVSALAAGAVAYVVTRQAGGDPTGPAGPVIVESVHNAGNQTVLISTPAEGEEGSTVIWLLEDEEEPEDGSATGEDPI